MNLSNILKLEKMAIREHITKKRFLTKSSLEQQFTRLSIS